MENLIFLAMQQLIAIQEHGKIHAFFISNARLKLAEN